MNHLDDNAELNKEIDEDRYVTLHFNLEMIEAALNLSKGYKVVTFYHRNGVMCISLARSEPPYKEPRNQKGFLDVEVVVQPLDGQPGCFKCTSEIIEYETIGETTSENGITYQHMRQKDRSEKD